MMEVEMYYAVKHYQKSKNISQIFKELYNVPENLVRFLNTLFLKPGIIL